MYNVRNRAPVAVVAFFFLFSPCYPRLPFHRCLAITDPAHRRSGVSVSAELSVECNAPPWLFSQAQNVATESRRWWLINAEGHTLGRLAAKLVPLLMGKHKPTYLAHVNEGDVCVVVNTDKIQFTGRKLSTNKRHAKLYKWHSGYPGGLKERSAWEVMQKAPTKPLELAVYGMLPRNNTRNDRMRRLRLFAGGQEELPDAMKQTLAAIKQQGLLSVWHENKRTEDRIIARETLFSTSLSGSAS